MRKRVVAIILRGDKILLIRRIKHGKKYYVFPGGSVEEGEAMEETVVRRIKEGTGLDISVDKNLGEYKNEKTVRLEYYFLVTGFAGRLQLGGPEAGRQSSENIYRFEWVPLQIIKRLDIIPSFIKSRIWEAVKNIPFMPQ